MMKKKDSSGFTLLRKSAKIVNKDQLKQETRSNKPPGSRVSSVSMVLLSLYSCFVRCGGFVRCFDCFGRSGGFAPVIS